MTSLAFDSEPLESEPFDSEPPDSNCLDSLDWGWEDSHVSGGTTCPSRPSTGTPPTTRTMAENHGGGKTEDLGGGKAEDQTLTSDWEEQEKLNEQELFEHWSLKRLWCDELREIAVGADRENGFNGWKRLCA